MLTGQQFTVHMHIQNQRSLIEYDRVTEADTRHKETNNPLN